MRKSNLKLKKTNSMKRILIIVLFSLQFIYSYSQSSSTNKEVNRLIAEEVQNGLISSCPSNVIISTNISGGVYEFLASNSITASNIISNGARVHYGANNSVRLVLGFKANTGVSFHADLFGCTSDIVADIEKKSNATELAEEMVEPKVNINIYPNPNSGIFTIASNSSEKMDVKIYSVIGNLIYSKTNVESNQRIDMPDLTSGIYFIEIRFGNKVHKEKLIYQK